MTGWSDLTGLRVGVWGTGVEGRATLRRLRSDGIEPTVIVDDSPSDGSVTWAAGRDHLHNCDIVIKSPGIAHTNSRYRELKGAGVRITVGLDLWMHDTDRSRVACITGTKGKSTTTAMAATLATGLGASVLAGGNIGIAPWDPDAAEADWYLIETSSYQAADLTIGPRVVAVTSLGQDHLPWHGSYDAYVHDKLSVCTRPGVEVVIAPSWDDELSRHADLLGPHPLLVEATEPGWVGALATTGLHNHRNALIARQTLVSLGVPGADDDYAIARAARNYMPLPSRLTPISSRGGVTWVDDSLSTNVLPSVAALNSFPGRRIALIVGGEDREIDYAPLGRAVAAHADDLLVLTVPDNGQRIGAAIRAEAPSSEVHDCADLRDAVQRAAAWATAGDVVLLSPAAPSFGRFRDYADRADHFAEEIRALGR